MIDFFIVNVEAAIFNGEKWLIIKRSEKEEHAPGILSLVGGKVDSKGLENDVLEKTAKREILEEVGIEVEDKIFYLESKEFFTAKNEKVIDVIFVCKYKSGEARVISEDEVAEIYWLNAEDIIKSVDSPIWLKESIEKAEDFRINFLEK
jgi:ADP-ribose pyrophosphatase YjhB (NUDIX family)